VIRRALVALSLTAVAATSLGSCAMSCPAALARGVLVADGPAGLGLRGDDGTVFHVRWAFGVGVRLDGDRLAIANPLGGVIAHEGDAVSLPGGTIDDETWGVCGDIAVDGRQQP
jgi:hypothetical protein